MEVTFGLLVLVTGLLISVLLLKGAKSLFGLSHPWWTHLPALAVFCMTISFVLLIAATSRDDPRCYFTMRQFISYFGPVGIMVIGISVLIDELWGRQEVRKTFNWMSLFDEVSIGVMLVPLGREFQSYAPQISATLLRCAIAMICTALLLELFRRPTPRDRYVVAEDTSALEAELARRTESGERISYFEGQNPAYLTVLVAAVGVALVFGAVMSWRAAMPWVSLLLLVFAGALALLYGGIRVSVTSTLLEVRLGMLGIRLLTLPTADISQVSVYGSAAIQDVGGRAGRGSRELTVFCLGNRRGVEVATAPGKRYLIGSDRPERLAAVIAAARGAGPSGAA